MPIAERIEQLSGRQPPINADFEIARADASQVHSGIGVQIGAIKARRAAQRERAFPVGQVLLIGLCGRRRIENRCRGTGAQEAEELSA